MQKCTTENENEKKKKPSTVSAKSEEMERRVNE